MTASTASVPASPAAARILLVEDEFVIRRTLARGMVRAGFEVWEAEDALSAMDAVGGQAPFDLAILDVSLPGMSGIKFAEWLRSNASTPFVMLSGNADDTVVQAAIHCGALSYLLKPIEVGQIVPVIRGALARGEDIRQLRENQRQIEHALQSDRCTSMAIGVLMQRHALGEREAFERLRLDARRHRVAISTHARRLLESASRRRADGKEEKEGR